MFVLSGVRVLESEWLSRIEEPHGLCLSDRFSAKGRKHPVSDSMPRIGVLHRDLPSVLFPEAAPAQGEVAEVVIRRRHAVDLR